MRPIATAVVSLIAAQQPSTAAPSAAIQRPQAAASVTVAAQQPSTAASSPTFGDIDTAFARLVDKTLYGTQLIEFPDGELVVTDLRDDLRKAFDVPPNTQGVLVFDGWDRDKPLNAGDLIQTVAGRPVKSVAEFRAAIQQASENDAATTLITRLRRGQAEVVPLAL